MIAALTRLAILVAWLVLAGSAAAQQIPALLDVPSGVAANHPELVARHDRLARERDTLRQRFIGHNAQCRAVEQGSAEDAECRRARAQLAADRDRHIAVSKAFNAAVRKAKASCVRDQGYQLIFAMRDCEHNQPSTFSYACLKGTGISAKSLACLATVPGATTGFPGAARALAACGIEATVPLDAANRCKDIKDACVAQAL